MSALAETHSDKKHRGAGFYIAIWIFLLCCTAATYGAAFIDMGAWNLPVGLAIAALKGTIVCLFFMHLWGDTRVNQFILILSLIFVALMISMTIADVNTRFPLTAPPNSERFKVSPVGQLE